MAAIVLRCGRPNSRMHGEAKHELRRHTTPASRADARITRIANRPTPGADRRTTRRARARPRGSDDEDDPREPDLRISRPLGACLSAGTARKRLESSPHETVREADLGRSQLPGKRQGPSVVWPERPRKITRDVGFDATPVLR